MNPSTRLFLFTGALSGALAVILGSLGAHGLSDRMCDKVLAIYQTGVQYQFYHSLALLGTGLFSLYKPSNKLTIAGWCFTGGMLLFSGSLYALSITGIRTLGAITPIGGIMLISGWIMFAAGVMIKHRKHAPHSGQES